jgi:hypothetical protein
MATFGTNILSYSNTNSIAESLGGFIHTAPYGYDGSNDRYDAFRHALISAELTRFLGEHKAKKIMDQHENDHPNLPNESSMDLWNNDVGRREYFRWKDAVENEEASDSLEKWIYDRVKQGETINDPIDHRSWIEPPEGSIPKPEALPSGDPFTGLPWPGADPLVNRTFRDAKGWSQPVDPLMLDLDGDGLELKGANGTVLFDHDADGIRTGTGWISADDGILVRDVSGNGLIDSGRELFGVDTLKRNGQRAVNGFDALADLDSNADGNFTSADAAWNEVKVAIK